jgi:hypothetical protein
MGLLRKHKHECHLFFSLCVRACVRARQHACVHAVSPCLSFTLRITEGKRGWAAHLCPWMSADTGSMSILQREMSRCVRSVSGRGLKEGFEIESTNTTCILLHMYQGSHVQACTGIFCIISYGGLILSAGLIGHSQLGAASRRVAFCHGSHFQGPNFQAVHSIMLSLGSTCHAVARTLSTHPGMVLTLERRRADAAG